MPHGGDHIAQVIATRMAEDIVKLRRLTCRDTRALIVLERFAVAKDHVENLAKVLKDEKNRNLLHQKTARNFRRAAKQRAHRAWRARPKAKAIADGNVALMAAVPAIADGDVALMAAVPAIADGNDALIAAVPAIADGNDALIAAVPAIADGDYAWPGITHEDVDTVLGFDIFAFS
jgi:hypothetical protein